MGLLDLFKKNKDTQGAVKEGSVIKTISGYKPVYHSHAGEIYEEGLVRAAIDARARHNSKLKVMIVGTAKPSLQAKMRLAPNFLMTWSQFLYRVSTILDIQNTSFIIPIYDTGMNITGYFPVLPSDCTVVEYDKEYYLRVKLKTTTVACPLRECAILTRFQYKSDFFGESNRALDETMDMIAIQDRGIKDAVNNSATYKFIAQVNNFAKADDLKNERLRFSEENLTKEAEAGGLLLFPNTYTNIQQVKQNAKAVDADEMRLIRENIYDYYGVNEKILRNEADAEELDAFFNGAIEPFAIQFSEAMTMAMFTERERAQGSILIANANRLQYMSTTAKVSMAQQLLDRGAMSINEARELFNYPPVENGDVRTIRGEYKDAEDMGGQIDATENQ